MNVRQIHVVVTTCCLFFVLETADAQVGTIHAGDYRVRRLLDEQGWDYEVDSDGDFKLVFGYEDGRTQLLYVNSNVQNLDGLRVREVWAPAIRFGDYLDQEVVLDLLQQNSVYKVGAWALVKDSRGYLAVFAATVSADTDAQTLAKVIRAVAVTADEKEKEVTGKDDN